MPLREPRPVQVQHVERGEHLHRVVMPVVNNRGINDRGKERERERERVYDDKMVGNQKGWVSILDNKN